MITFQNKKEPTLLLFGDFVAFTVALWVALLLRYGNVPSGKLFNEHFIPFFILFIVWIGVFFIAGLYERHTQILRNRLGGILLRAQLTNSFLAVLFFYLVPYFGITPKTILFLHLFASFILIFSWRSFAFPLLEAKNRQSAVLIGTGEEMNELMEEVNSDPRYSLRFVSSLDLSEMKGFDLREEIIKRIYADSANVVAVDFKNEKVEPLLPKLYSLIFSNVRFIDMHKIYEDIFDRIPLSLVKYSWFLEHISGAAEKSYDILKRAMDVAVSLILGVVSIIFYPFVAAAIKIEDRGPIFFRQGRVGQNNKEIKVIKFRSMKVHNDKDGVAIDPQPTRVGGFLRKTRIDELPQLWNVLRGDLSLVGPRPEIPALVKLYEKEIPYYNIRHLIKPGLSGWAQLYHNEPPKFAAGVSETKKKLSYDLFYIKNRSLLLDLKVALRTIKVLLSREGI